MRGATSRRSRRCNATLGRAMGQKTAFDGKNKTMHPPRIFGGFTKAAAVIAFKPRTQLPTVLSPIWQPEAEAANFGTAVCYRRSNASTPPCRLWKRGWPDSLQRRTPIDRSSSAPLVLNAAADLQGAYSRMPLLTSPSISYKLTEQVQVQWAPDLNSPANEATMDGQAECSPDVARSLGLLPEQVTANSPGLCKSAQFRGVLPLGKNHILCKGMVLLNCHLPNGTLLMREKCIKMRWSSSTWPSN